VAMEPLVAYCALVVSKEKALSALKEATAPTALAPVFGSHVLLLSSKSVHEFRIGPGFTHWYAIWTIERDGKRVNITSMFLAIFVSVRGSIWSR
jgi:hypothetical protein